MAVIGVPVVIDGAYSSAGASLVRTSLAMSSLTQQPVRIINIRAESRRPGLTPEDLAILKAFTRCCTAEVIGGQVRERSLSFIPTRRPYGMNGAIDVPDDDDGPGHANALVVLSSLLPVLARAGVYSTLSCRGETYGKNVLTFDYFHNVTLRALKSLGLYAYCDLLSVGFGQGSRGEVSMEVEPSHIDGITWADRGKPRAVRAVVLTSELPDAVSQRGIAHLARLGFYAGIEVECIAGAVRGRSPGAFVTVWGEFERGVGGATALGARGIRMEAVAQTAFEGFLEWYKSDCCVDPFLADQLLLPAALAEGPSVFTISKITDRFLAVAYALKQFLPIHITVKGKVGETGMVTIKR